MVTQLGRAVVGVLLLALSLSGCDGPPLGRADFYRLGPGATEITLLVIGSPSGSATAEVTEETDSHVTVRVEIPDPDAGGNRPGMGKQFEVVVRLAAPLGSRTVLNLDGSAVLPEPIFRP